MKYLVFLATLSTALSADVAILRADVTLQVTVDGGIPPAELATAKTTVAGVFKQAGIALHWQSSTSRDTRGDQGYGASPVIRVRIKEHAARAEHPGALGYTLIPFEGEAESVVFYDRVVATLPFANSTLLGYAVAHEVAHALLRTLTHSQTGLMQARWTRPDYSLMQGRLLFFSPDEARAMQQRRKFPAGDTPNISLEEAKARFAGSSRNRRGTPAYNRTARELHVASTILRRFARW